MKKINFNNICFWFVVIVNFVAASLLLSLFSPSHAFMQMVGSGVATVISGDQTIYFTSVYTTDVVNSYTNSGGANHIDSINDTAGAPDDDTTYIYRVDATGAHWFSHSSSLTGSGIEKIVVHFRGKRTETGACSQRVRLKVNGTIYAGTDQAQTTDYAEYTQEYTTNPNTSEAWTQADVEGTGDNPLQAINIDARSMAAGEEVRCTQMYFVVHYN